MRSLRVRAGAILAALAIALSGSVANALEVRDLYLIEVPIKSQSDQERAQAIRTGLAQVVVRVTGASGALTDSYVAQQLTRAQDYVQQFNFVTTEKRGESGDIETIKKLKLQFDETLVNGLLRGARLPIWGSNRPSLMLWIVQEQDGRRALVGADEQDAITEAVSGAAELRGVPVVFPLLDLEDQASLTPLDAWGLFQQRIETASLRYAPAAILAGRMFQDGAGRWQGSWLFIFNERAIRFSMSGAGLDADITAAIDKAADQLAAYYAVSTSPLERARLQVSVSGIDTIGDYDRVSRYLGRLAAVSSHGINRVVEDQIVFTVDTDVSQAKFREELALDNKLAPMEEDGELATPGAILRYRWRR